MDMWAGGWGPGERTRLLANQLLAAGSLLAGWVGQAAAGVEEGRARHAVVKIRLLAVKSCRQQP
eukprot:364214-Chlamydomonas_euryale.AAC.5